MSGFRLLLAMSADGFLARGPDDDMRWTGRTDKAVFRLLTLSGTNGYPDTVLAGARTFDMMPKLKDRDMVRLSRGNRHSKRVPEDVKRQSVGLDWAQAAHRGAWLIGGPTIAEVALEHGMVDRAFICVSKHELGGGISADPVLAYLPEQPLQTIQVGDVEVRVYTEDQPWRGR